LYLGIDQHARQITISLRDASDYVLQSRQVSTEPERVQAFFAKLTQECLRRDESFIAVLEVCGFNDWLIRLLRQYRCHQVILIQSEERKKHKTDRRDAAALSELLWVNRERFLAGKPVRGLRRVEIAETTDQDNRSLTTLNEPPSSINNPAPPHSADQRHHFQPSSTPAPAGKRNDLMGRENFNGSSGFMGAGDSMTQPARVNLVW